MNRLLKFLLDYYSFLYRDHGFRLSDSYYWPKYCDNAFIDMKSGHLGVRFERDRGVMSLSFIVSEDTYESAAYFDVGLLCMLLRGDAPLNELTIEEEADFVERNCRTIFEIFSPEHRDNTTKVLQKMGEKRSDLIFRRVKTSTGYITLPPDSLEYAEREVKFLERLRCFDEGYASPLALKEQGWMDGLLKFLFDHYSFLYTTYGFRFIDSASSLPVRENAYIDMKSENVKTRLVQDKGRIALVFHIGGEDPWCDIQTLQELLTGQSIPDEDSAVKQAEIVREQLPSILKMFSESNLPKTIEDVHRFRA